MFLAEQKKLNRKVGFPSGVEVAMGKYFFKALTQPPR
jgi:hypothetical protein